MSKTAKSTAAARLVKRHGAPGYRVVVRTLRADVYVPVAEGKTPKLALSAYQRWIKKAANPKDDTEARSKAQQKRRKKS